MPHLFCVGNHDWSYSSSADDLKDRPPELSAEQLRDDWVQCKGYLLPLFEGCSPLCWSADIAGLRFVGVDNSTYQVSESQLATFKEVMAAASGPVCLLVHIPLWLTELQSAMRSRGLGGYAGSALCGDPASSNVAYRPTAATEEFLQLVHKVEQLVCVLAGHIHTAQTHRIRGEWAKIASGRSFANHPSRIPPPLVVTIFPPLVV